MPTHNTVILGGFWRLLEIPGSPGISPAASSSDHPQLLCYLCHMQQQSGAVPGCPSDVSWAEAQTGQRAAEQPPPLFTQSSAANLLSPQWRKEHRGSPLLCKLKTGQLLGSVGVLGTEGHWRLPMGIRGSQEQCGKGARDEVSRGVGGFVFAHFLCTYDVSTCHCHTHSVAGQGSLKNPHDLFFLLKLS